jgi:hypothetical protein
VTTFINFRGSNFGTVLHQPQLFESSGAPPTAQLILPTALGAKATGRDVVVATHGFNVSYIYGLQSLANLDAALGLSPALFIGVLWPGDWVIPAVNYPFAVGIAREAGKRLGLFLKATLAGASTVSFISHSLGARVVLEAVEQLGRPAKVICLTAAAVNADCLSAEYSAADSEVTTIVNLASDNDLVLKLAYPAGDLIATILHPDHNAFQRAMGALGPAAPVAPNITAYQISRGPAYDHGDYLPPDVVVPPANDAKWSAVAQFMQLAIRNRPEGWPNNVAAP